MSRVKRCPTHNEALRGSHCGACEMERKRGEWAGKRQWRQGWPFGDIDRHWQSPLRANVESDKMVPSRRLKRHYLRHLGSREERRLAAFGTYCGKLWPDLSESARDW